MTLNRIKLYVIALFILPVVAVMIFSTKPLGTVAMAGETEAATTYKTKCAMCHSPKAEKLFDPAKTDEELVEAILKGKKGEKPPFMPAFETKGMTSEQAKDLVLYMKGLRKPAN
jgi:mono/diheme cytochrome c family protein